MSFTALSPLLLVLFLISETPHFTKISSSFPPPLMHCGRITHRKQSETNSPEWEQKNIDKAIGYSFAIVGINITDLAFSLLISGALKTHLYNVAPETPSLRDLQQTFCYLMQEFQRFWVDEDPSDIMEFNRVRSKFHRRILRQLKDLDTALCPHFTASDLHLVNL